LISVLLSLGLDPPGTREHALRAKAKKAPESEEA
jgi:hypothetical protein